VHRAVKTVCFCDPVQKLTFYLLTNFTGDNQHSECKQSSDAESQSDVIVVFLDYECITKIKSTAVSH